MQTSYLQSNPEFAGNFNSKGSTALRENEDHDTSQPSSPDIPIGETSGDRKSRHYIDAPGEMRNAGRI